MTRVEKDILINELSEKFDAYNCFYITDSSGLNVDQVNILRKECHDKEIEFRVAKNKLIIKALEKSKNEYDQLYDILKGPTSLFFSKVANSPAKVMKNFRKNFDKPVIKAVYIDSEILVGDEHLDTLANLKSKEELLGEIIGLLKSPIIRVISALQSSSVKLGGLMDALGNRAESSEEVKKTKPEDPKNEKAGAEVESEEKAEQSATEDMQEKSSAEAQEPQPETEEENKSEENDTKEENNKEEDKN